MANDVDQNDQNLCPDCGESHSAGQANRVCTADGGMPEKAKSDGKDGEVISFAPEDPLPAPDSRPQFNRSSQRTSDAGAGTFDPTVKSQLPSSRPESAPEDLVGHNLSDRYTLLELIGKGGMSAVYKAKDLKLNKFLAIKVLLPHLMANPLSLQRFQVEAQAASSLSHPNLITTHDFGITQDGRPYLVMELLDGQSLSEILKEEKRLPVDRAVPIFIQISDALAHAHGKGVLHRDLKPSNVLVSTTDNGIDFVRLLDFGIAKMLPQEGAESMGLTQTGEVFGSPNYMSPEQCQGLKVDARADVYSMGCLMYEILTGRPPLVGDNIMDTLLKQMNDPPQSFKSVDPNLNIPQQMELIVFKALAKDPNDRYSSAQALGEALRAFQQNVTVLLFKHIQNRWQMAKFKIRPFKKREKKMLIFTAIVSILFLAVAGKLLSSYLEINVPTVSGSNKIFMPEVAPRPTGRLEQESLFESDLHHQERMLQENPNSPAYDQYTRSLADQADTYVNNGHIQEAANRYRNLADLLNKNDGKASKPAKTITEKLADCLFKLGQYKEAAVLYEELLSYVHSAGEDTHMQTNDLRLKLATSLYAQRRYTEAAPVFERALRALGEGNQFDNPDYAITCARLADCYRQRSLWTEAITQYEHASRAYENLLQNESYAANQKNIGRTAIVDYYRAYCLLKLDKLDEAAKAYKTAIPQLKKLSGPLQELAVVALLQNADIQWRQGKYFDAIATRMKARDMQNLISE